MDIFKKFLAKIFGFATDDSSVNKTRDIGQYNYKDPIANKNIDVKKADIPQHKSAIVTKTELLQQKTMLMPIGSKNIDTNNQKNLRSQQAIQTGAKQMLSKENLNMATANKQGATLKNNIGNKIAADNKLSSANINTAYNKIQPKDPNLNTINTKESKMSASANAIAMLSKESKANALQNITNAGKLNIKIKTQINKLDKLETLEDKAIKEDGKDSKDHKDSKDKIQTPYKKIVPVAPKTTKDIKEVIWEGDAIEVEFSYMVRNSKIRTNALIKKLEKLKDGSYNLTGKCKASNVSNKVFSSKDIVTKLIVPGCKNRLTINEWAKALAEELELA